MFYYFLKQRTPYCNWHCLQSFCQDKLWFKQRTPYCTWPLPTNFVVKTSFDTLTEETFWKETLENLRVLANSRQCMIPFMDFSLFVNVYSWEKVFLLWINRLRFDLKQLQVSEGVKGKKYCKSKTCWVKSIIAKKSIHH